MKREIKFKGIARDGKWIKGDLIHHWDKIGDTCISNVNETYEVLAETICQFTGLKDKNGVEIYEGDVFAIDKNYYGLVLFNQDKTRFEVNICDPNDKLEDVEEIEDIKEDYSINGNIYD